MAIQFGLGQLVGVISGTPNVPVVFALLEDLSIDIAMDLVELAGPNMFAVAGALAKGKITAKAKVGSIQGALLNQVLPGSSIAAGQKAGKYAEPWAIPATPFQVTVAQSATWSEDLGVLNTSQNRWMQPVTGSPATGQYSVAAGVYTFAAADTGNNVQISYDYTVTPATGKTTTFNNVLAGTTPIMALRAYDQWTMGSVSNKRGFAFPAVIVPKLTMALKPTAFTEHDIEMHIIQDPASSLLATIYTAE